MPKPGRAAPLAPSRWWIAHRGPWQRKGAKAAEIFTLARHDGDAQDVGSPNASSPSERTAIAGCPISTQVDCAAVAVSAASRLLRQRRRGVVPPSVLDIKPPTYGRVASVDFTSSASLGEEVAVLVHPGGRRGLEAEGPTAGGRLDLVPRHRRADPSDGRARSEYTATVVLCRLFWLQSMKTLPGRATSSSSR